MLKILVTGASGFIGKALAYHLQSTDYQVYAGVRCLPNSSNSALDYIHTGSLFNSQELNRLLNNIDVVIHSAGRAHIMNANQSYAPLSDFRKHNTQGTIQLANLANSSGVKRFIFLSSSKVNGEYSIKGNPFKACDPCFPDDPYARSKYEAEQYLVNLAKNSNMETVIIRPPLVYGPGVKGNFLTLLKAINRQIPLPFGALHSKRSLIGLENLINFITLCIHHPKAANEIFLVSDNQDISTSELLIKIATHFRKKPILLPIPPSILKLLFVITGNKRYVSRLLMPFQLNCSKAVELLNWSPALSIDEQLIKIADDESKKNF